ncbi:uncharacterized protein L3040_008249 [Drepanopeziza brunnea f. sp. 'multigermtubi']|uniref:uncharacterized protein n=1 Tax=Drepanopeziza brunnea f. sp. 'multigermtubi' TaxID=698441 RepID=UPI00239CD92E|nr:hypothetical protein L3040_008249 [Drepanopeziza brunnea f. sp. 'multigermtubi']
MAYYDSEIPRPAPYGTSRPPRQAGRSCDEPEERRGRKAHNYAAYDTEFDEPDEPDEPYRRADGRPHSRSRRYFRARSRSQRRAHSPAPEGSLPHDPVRDTSAVAYTYEEDEPASIPIAPAPWNGHRSSITKEALIAFLVDQGCHPKRAAAQVDREFSAHAVQWVAGRADPFLSRSEHGVRDPPRSRRFEASPTANAESAFSAAGICLHATRT